MDQLGSMLVPLETLEGWQDAPPVGALEALGLLVGLPIAATVVIIIYVMITSKREQRLAAESGVIEPLWLGGGESRGPMLESGIEPATSNKTAARRAHAPEEERPGGASARW